MFKQFESKEKIVFGLIAIAALLAPGCKSTQPRPESTQLASTASESAASPAAAIGHPVQVFGDHCAYRTSVHKDASGKDILVMDFMGRTTSLHAFPEIPLEWLPLTPGGPYGYNGSSRFTYEYKDGVLTMDWTSGVVTKEHIELTIDAKMLKPSRIYYKYRATFVSTDEQECLF